MTIIVAKEIPNSHKIILIVLVLSTIISTLLVSKFITRVLEQNIT